MPATPDPVSVSHTNRAARRAARTGAVAERRYADPRRVSVPPPRLWAMRRH